MLATDASGLLLKTANSYVLGLYSCGCTAYQTNLARAAATAGCRALTQAVRQLLFSWYSLVLHRSAAAAAAATNLPSPPASACTAAAPAAAAGPAAAMLLPRQGCQPCSATRLLPLPAPIPAHPQRKKTKRFVTWVGYACHKFSRLQRLSRVVSAQLAQCDTIPLAGAAGTVAQEPPMPHCNAPRLGSHMHWRTIL